MLVSISEQIARKRKRVKFKPLFYLWLLGFAIRECTLGALGRLLVAVDKKTIVRLVVAGGDAKTDQLLRSRLLNNAQTYSRQYPNLVAPVYDAMSHVLACCGTYEPHVQECLRTDVFPKLNTDGIALDLGANIGIHTCLFSATFAKTYAFEIDPKTAKILQLNMDFYAINEVTVVAEGASNKNGSVVGYASKILGNCTSLSPQESIHSNPGGSDAATLMEEREFSVCRLDDCITQDEHERIVFVKMDVEDHELQALQGMPEILQKAKPVIGFEVLDRSFDKNGEQDVLKYLKGAGYQHFYEVDRKSARLKKRDHFPVMSYDMIIASHKSLQS